MKDVNVQNSNTKVGVGREITTLLKTNIRDYAMYIALVLIFLFFGFKTNGLFLSSRNLTD
jgi:putative multiple sugar transport system permease protein